MLQKLLVTALSLGFGIGGAQACNERLYKGIQIVFIEKSGETCAIAERSPPFNSMIPVRQGPGIFAYTWPYQHKPLQVGFLYITVDDAGNGKATIEFSNGEQFDGDTFTAFVSFLDLSGNVLETVGGTHGVDGRLAGHDRKAYLHKVSRSRRSGGALSLTSALRI